MNDTGRSLKGPAMRSFGAATGMTTTTPGCSTSTTTIRPTATTMSASVYPSSSHLDDGHGATEGIFLVESVPQDPAKARQQAKPKTAAEPKGAVAESGSDFMQLTSLENLFSCWMKAKRNKGNRLRIQRFNQNPLSHLITIQSRLRSYSYEFGPYKTFTVREKKWREVVDAPIKDRIVHWMLYEYLLPIWQPRFIQDTFGNLPGRGSHAAVKRLAAFARQPTNQWALQLDISKYFHSVPHLELAERAVRYVGDHSIRQLMYSLIGSYRTGNQYDHLFGSDSAYCCNQNKGMPIGNLTSQLLANKYLNRFDHWIKEALKVKSYIRYVDDMVFLASSKEELQTLCQVITARLASEGINIHPNKIRIAPVSAGVPFLGYVVWPHHISAGSYLRRRHLHALRQHESGIYDRSEALNSYTAALSHTGLTIN